MWSNSPETQELLDQAQRGEQDAVERLLAGHREPLRRMISLRLDPALVGRVDASDVVQEVLLEASRRLRDYLRDPVMPFHLWLRHLARELLLAAPPGAALDAASDATPLRPARAVSNPFVAAH